MKKQNKKLAKVFDLTSRYIDDLIITNNPRFKQFLKDIYPEELVVSETSESRNVESYLDLLIDMSNGDLVCSMFDKRDAFVFDIFNFPNLSGNIPAAPAYGTNISQLIRYRNYAVIMTTFLFDIPCLQKDFSAKVFLRKTDEKILQIYG